MSAVEVTTIIVPKARPTGIVRGNRRSISSGVAALAMSTSSGTRSSARSRTVPPTTQPRQPASASTSATERAARARGSGRSLHEGRMALEH